MYFIFPGVRESRQSKTYIHEVNTKKGEIITDCGDIGEGAGAL